MCAVWYPWNISARKQKTEGVWERREEGDREDQSELTMNTLHFKWYMVFIYIDLVLMTTQRTPQHSFCHLGAAHSPWERAILRFQRSACEWGRLGSNRQPSGKRMTALPPEPQLPRSLMTVMTTSPSISLGSTQQVSDWHSLLKQLGIEYEPGFYSAVHILCENTSCSPSWISLHGQTFPLWNHI